VTRNPTAAGWLVSPAFDLFFIANIGWIFALLPWGETGPLEFTQLYFVTTPHRWLTLLLVITDPDRRYAGSGYFASLALVVCLALVGVWFFQGDFTCLLLVDYLWNAWHFASQHAGVLRVYGKRCGEPKAPFLEAQGLRFFIIYVIARTAGWTTGWLEPNPMGQWALTILDFALLFVPACLVTRAIYCGPGNTARNTYLASVCLLYSILLIGMMFHSRWLTLSLTMAAALFHAAEYIALVTQYAWRRRHIGSEGLFQHMAMRWLFILSVFLLVIGSLAACMENLREIPAWWMGLNLWAAFLHYAYDGMIWKLRRPETARALGADA